MLRQVRRHLWPAGRFNLKTFQMLKAGKYVRQVDIAVGLFRCLEQVAGQVDITCYL